MDCIFCKIAAGQLPSTTIYENEEFRVFFDINPASKGHCLVIPKVHYANAYEIDKEVAGRAFQLAVDVARELKKELNCDGVNILQNNEEVAGQTVFHFHLHVIPRYSGDGVVIGGKTGEPDMELLSKLAEKIGNNL